MPSILCLSLHVATAPTDQQGCPSQVKSSQVKSSQVKPARVLELYEEMGARDIPRGHTHYNYALQAIMHHDELPNAVSRAQVIYESMRASGHRLETRTLLALVRLCERHDRPDMAARLRRERSLLP